MATIMPCRRYANVCIIPNMANNVVAKQMHTVVLLLSLVEAVIMVSGQI